MGYTKRYRELDNLPGVGDGEKEFYLDDASGYISRYELLAVKLPEDKICRRCGRPACWIVGRIDHFLCLRCRDDWWDFTSEPGHQINNRMSNWEKLFQVFLKN